MEFDPIKRPKHYLSGCSPSTKTIVHELTGVHPDHYADECKKYIKAVKPDFFVGSAIGYLWRCEFKGELEQDLGKTIEHLQDAIDVPCELDAIGFQRVLFALDAVKVLQLKAADK